MRRVVDNEALNFKLSTTEQFSFSKRETAHTLSFLVVSQSH